MAHSTPEFELGHYVPIVLTRQGERHALRELPPHVKGSFTPLFVIHPIELDLDTGQPKRPVAEHVRRLASQLPRDWGTGPAFVDMTHLDLTQRMEDGTHPTEALAKQCADEGLVMAPVINSGSDATDREAAVRVAKEFGTSLCFRLPPEEWADLGTAQGDGRLLSLLSQCALPASQVHMVLDAGEVRSAQLVAAALRNAIHALPATSDWRSLVVAGTGMPSRTASVGPDNATELPRLEWKAWRLLTEAGQYRLPTFGDYAVQNPDPLSDFDPRLMDSSAQLRYTIPGAWFIARGRGIKARGTEQIRSLAAQVVNHPDYAGPEFSWGDSWLADCAAGSCSAGNQGVWRKATTNHHLTYVVEQVANLVGS